MSELPESVPQNPDRESNGQFTQGNRGGPGNPFARQVAMLRKLVLSAMTEDRMRQLVEFLFECAMKGDMAAAKMLLQYSLGKPAEAVEPDRIDVEEHKLREESAIPLDRVMDYMDRLSAQYVNI